MEVLRQAGEALNNGNIPALNRLVQGVGIETGQSPAMTYDALAGKVNQEVERVAAGGTAPYKEDIERGLKLLSHNASPAQREGVLRAYTNLMYGRLNSLDESYHATTGEHMTNVPKEATQLFQRYGNDVPWHKITGKVSNSSRDRKLRSTLLYKALLPIDCQTVLLINGSIPTEVFIPWLHKEGKEWLTM